MDSANSMSLDDIFGRLKDNLETIIEETKKRTNGSKSQEQSISDLINYTQSISAKALESYLKEYELHERIFSILIGEPPSFLSTILIKTLINRLIKLNQFNTLIRSARKISKKNQLAYNFHIILQRLLDSIRTTIKSTKEQQTAILRNRKDIVPSSIKWADFEGFKLNEAVEYYSRLGSTSQKWYYINKEKLTRFRIITPKVDFLQKILPNLEKKEFTLSDIQNSTDFASNTYEILQILNKQDLTQEFDDITPELLWVYNKLGLFQEIPEKNKSIDTNSKLIRLISNAYFEMVTELFRNTKYENIVDEPFKILSKITLLCENGIQEELSKLNLTAPALEQEYKSQIAPLQEKITVIGDWVFSLKSFLGAYANTTDKFREIIRDISNEIQRKQVEFEDYSDVVFEHDTRATLDHELDLILQALEHKVKSYENTTLRLIEEEIPQIKEITLIVRNFQNEFDVIHKRAQDMFIKYQKDNVNIYDAVQRWEETFIIEKNRAEFIVTKMLSALIEKFQTIMKQEEGFMQISSEFSFDEKNLSLMLTPGILIPETLTDDQIRNQMHHIEKRIGDLEKMKSVYTQTLISYKALLEKRLETKENIKSKICVVCHTDIDMVTDDYIKCEFCGRLSHYLCTAWWLEKHNSCPVCGNVYLIPGSDLYDSDKVER